MDAHALLISHGWRGSGHSLHATSDSMGLSKPILVAKKQNNSGVGKKQHKTSDMWWMNAFDKSLKGLDTSEEGKVVQTVTTGGLDLVAKGGSKYVGSGGLYGFFVRGESLSGTIQPEEIDTAYEDNTVESKADRKARRAARRAARESLKVTAATVKDSGSSTSAKALLPLSTCDAPADESDQAQTKSRLRKEKVRKKLFSEVEVLPEDPDISKRARKEKRKRKEKKQVS